MVVEVVVGTVGSTGGGVRSRGASVVVVVRFASLLGIVVVVVDCCSRSFARSSELQVPTHTFTSIAASSKVVGLRSRSIATTASSPTTHNIPPSACTDAGPSFPPMGSIELASPPRMIEAPRSVVTTTAPCQIARDVAALSTCTDDPLSALSRNTVTVRPSAAAHTPSVAFATVGSTSVRAATVRAPSPSTSTISRGPAAKTAPSTTTRSEVESSTSKALTVEPASSTRWAVRSVPSLARYQASPAPSTTGDAPLTGSGAPEIFRGSPWRSGSRISGTGSALNT